MHAPLFFHHATWTMMGMGTRLVVSNHDHDIVLPSEETRMLILPVCVEYTGGGMNNMHATQARYSLQY